MQHAVVALSDQLGKPFVLGNLLGAGKRGAWSVWAADGTCGVLKASPCAEYRHVVERMVRVVEELRAAGYPAPRPLCHGPVPGGGYFYLQERAAGRPLRSGGVWPELNGEELALLLNLLDRHAGLAPDVPQDWSQHVELMVGGRSSAWAVIKQSSVPAVQGLTAACRRCLEKLDAPSLPRDDLVMGDFGPHNVLVDEYGKISAVIDLDDAGRGTRVIDTVGLLYMVTPGLLSVVRDAALQVSDPEVLTLCGVYWIIRRLYVGLTTSDPGLESAAAQMLAYVDLLT